MLDETRTVERAKLDIRSTAALEGKIEGVSENRMTPLTNPVTGAENEVRIVKTRGFIWLDGEIAESDTFQVELPEMAGTSPTGTAVFSSFDYANS